MMASTTAAHNLSQADIQQADEAFAALEGAYSRARDAAAAAEAAG